MGKSTPMKIIPGVYAPDEGEFLLREQEIRLDGPLDAPGNDIAMIHREPNLVPFMTVAESIWVRREPPNRLGFVDHRELNRRKRKPFRELSIDTDPEVEMRTLSIASRQMVEIARVVSCDSDVLVMDEPTPAPTDREVEHLFRIVRQLRDQGTGIVDIPHKMDDLARILAAIVHQYRQRERARA